MSNDLFVGGVGEKAQIRGARSGPVCLGFQFMAGLM